MPNNVVHSQKDEKYWEKAKSKVREEYPNVEEGSDDFYKITMGIYKKMTKSASGEDIINNLRAEGVISKNAVDKYREETQYLNIVSKLFNPQEEKVADFGYLKNVGSGILTGLGIAGAGYGIASGVGGIRKYLARRKRPERLKEIAKFAPIVKEMDPALVNEGMRTLEDYNPEMAKHPLIAASFLKSIHNYGGITPEQANILKGDSYGGDLTRNLEEGIGISSRFHDEGGTSDLIKAHEFLTDYAENALPSKQFFLANGAEPIEFGKERARIREKIKRNISKYSSDEREKTKFGDIVKDVGTGTLVAGLAVAGLTGVGKAGSVLYNKLTRKKRLDAVKKYSPELKKVNPELLNVGMKTLERLNPSVSRDPLAAGGFLKEIVKRKGLKSHIAENIADILYRDE